jgi:hypothetical protein
MLEITNRQKFPVQLVIKSGKRTRSFTTINIPGVGRGKNVFLTEEEKLTEYILRAEKKGLITIKQINTRKGD